MIAVLLLLIALSPGAGDALTTNKNSPRGCLVLSTFNILAPVHRSMDALNHRESEREDWWRPRAEGVADYISRKLSSSDVILLQEWWFDEKFADVFDSAIGDSFDIIAERRPGAGGEGGDMRDDGMCCLVRRKGELEFVKSEKVLTGPQRIAQIIQCRERRSDGQGRDVFIANSHLSFPRDQDAVVNGQRQANEAAIILNALATASKGWDTTRRGKHCGIECLEVMCGDFNSNSRGLAASLAESPPHNFVNCASATAAQMLADLGGRVNIGATHRDHLGQRVSVDHVFLRLVRRDGRGPGRCAAGRAKRSRGEDRCAALALGYLDTKGTRVLGVLRGDIRLEGGAVVSDHRPVTAKIAWPRTAGGRGERLSEMYMNATMPLDPLQPAWGIVELAREVVTD